MLAQDLLETAVNNGLLTGGAGGLMVRRLLEAGGTMPAIELLRSILGREPQSTPFFALLRERES